MCAHPALRGQRFVAPDRCPCHLGPGAGEKGGKLLFEGTPEDVEKMDVNEALKSSDKELLIK